MPIVPYVPVDITVHLGRPDRDARNVTVSFPDYIKNVASSEIYPPWPDAAIRANIYCQISFALNRIYTEWYPSQGYDFDITSSTAFDQFFVEGRDIFENISVIVDEIFNNYLRRPGQLQPFFAQYCNEVSVTCAGLSQWGTVDLAKRGFTPYQILTYYYGDNLEIVYDAPIYRDAPSYPGTALRLGDRGDNVRLIQRRLNAVSANYPSINKVEVDGVFGEKTQEAVKKFQNIFELTPDGIVGKATWYKLGFVTANVLRLAELDSIGLSFTGESQQFQRELSLGSAGNDVRAMQYFLNTIAEFIQAVQPSPINGTFDQATQNSLISFQRLKNLPQTGVLTLPVFESLYNEFVGIILSIPRSYGGFDAAPYPGFILRLGMTGREVEALNVYLLQIAQVFPEIPRIIPDDVFSTYTRDAVIAFQNLFGLTPDGLVGPETWNKIAEVYTDIVLSNIRQREQAPGTVLMQTQEMEAL